MSEPVDYLVGVEEYELAFVEDVLDDNPSESQTVYKETIDISERAIAAVAAQRAASGGGGGGGSPSGSAGGVLDGTYPNPTFAEDMATQSELDAHVNDTSAAHAASAISASSTTLSGTGTDVQAVLEELDNLLDDHSARHENGGADEISIAGLDGTPTELANHLADTSDAHDASAISVVSTTLVGTGTDAQAVFEELDNAIVAAEAATAAHLADTSAAHAASAISADSTTLVGTGTDVQAVLEELDNGIADHLADTSAAHAASAISFTPNGSIAATDVQAAIQEVRDEAGAASTDGWTSAADTWTYASATTFTISGVDRTAIFTPGTRLKLTQTTAKYFVVASSSFSTNTTVTITGGSDYSLANASITSPYYSYQANPQGYPGTFAYTPIVVGFTSPTISTARFAVNGRVCHVFFDISGTSNSASFTFTPPILPRTVTGGLGFNLGVLIVNNGTISNTPGRIHLFSGETVFTIQQNANGTGFTTSGSKEAIGQIFYEI